MTISHNLHKDMVNYNSRELGDRATSDLVQAGDSIVYKVTRKRLSLKIKSKDNHSGKSFGQSIGVFHQTEIG